MIGQILGSARLIIQILLVVAAVVLVYMWNPMNVFGGKATLKPTANMVSEIREIGEMITAEYYGEVLTSIDEVQIDFQQEPQINLQAEATFDKIQEEIDNLRNFHKLTLDQRLEIGDPDNELKRRVRTKTLVNEVGKSNILEKLNYLGDWQNTSRMLFFNEVLSFIYLKQNDKEDVITEPLRENRLTKTLEKWYLDDSNAEWSTEAFTLDYFSSKLSDLPRSEAKKKLAMIGRGTVKAGFDFKDLQSHMYYLNEEVGELHIFGLAPKILNADINPWFIPEKGIPGFDLLTYNGKVNFKDSKKVKIYAVQKLKTNARTAGIIEQAELNGGQTISRLVNLLTEVEVKKVIFHHDEIIDLTKEIQKDHYISYEEAALFERTLEVELDKIDSLKEAQEDRYNNRNLAENKLNTLVQMLKQLQTNEFEDQSLTYNHFATFWYRISVDGLIDEKDWTKIINTNKEMVNNRTAALWTNMDTLLLRAQWNVGLHQMLQDSIAIGEYLPKTMALRDWENRDLRIPVRNIALDLTDSIVSFDQFDPNNEIRDSLLHLISLEKYQPAEWDKWIKEKESIANIGKKDSLSSFANSPSKFWLYHKDDPNHIKEVNIPLNKITFPMLLGLDIHNNVEIGNHIVFKSSENLLEDLKQPNSGQETGLTDSQLDGLEQHLTNLYTQHQAYHNRDFLTRANHWFTEKMESKSGILDKFK
ncbi:DUF4230 domain-containing protein [uncultured Cyclobacterium sp.]|uniref:DUF4230 domain-containing protein n=1 Tax=uncultured Cyclobacterium sp. TaxID=453820 RepID=UPI0030EC1FEF